MERVLLPVLDDGANRKVNLQLLCVIDPTLSDQLLPVPKPAIADRIESVLATLPETPKFSIGYCLLLPTSCLTSRARVQSLLREMKKRNTAEQGPDGTESTEKQQLHAEGVVATLTDHFYM